MSEGEEKSITRELWEKVFEEDSVNFLDYYYEYKCRDNTIYVIEQDGKAVSMLQRNPYVMNVNGTKVPADYIVGVATDKEFRHRGLMASLLKRALNDMADEGRAFTFLMPAAEAIYTPFGFRFVYAQPVCKENINSNDDINADETATNDRKKAGRGTTEVKDNVSDKFLVVSMTDSLFDKFSKQINGHLEQSYDVYSVRTRQYFEDLTEQYKSDGGSVCCVLTEDRLAASFNWWLSDKGAEVTELICFDSDRDAVIVCIKDYFRKTYKVNSFVIRGEVPEDCDYENRIMLRITNVPELLKFIRSDRALRIKLNVRDSIISKNNRTFLWEVSEDKSEACEVDDTVIKNDEADYSLKAASFEPDDFDCELDISIEELALWLFKGGLPEGDSILKHIKPLSKIFINEIV